MSAEVWKPPRWETGHKVYMMLLNQHIVLCCVPSITAETAQNSYATFSTKALPALFSESLG